MRDLKREENVQALNSIEQQAIDELYNQNYYMLLNYAMSILRDADMAEEAVQETFRIACVRVKKLLECENPTGWLVKALQNTLKKAVQSKLQAVKYIAELPDDFDFENIVDNRPIDEDVDILYADLTADKAYQLMKRYAVEDKSIKTIAEEDGISIAACKQRLSRARKKLSELIERQNK